MSGPSISHLLMRPLSMCTAWVSCRGVTEKQEAARKCRSVMEVHRIFSCLASEKKCSFVKQSDVERKNGGLIGGCNYFLIFTPKIGEDEPILTRIFFKGVETKFDLHPHMTCSLFGNSRKSTVTFCPPKSHQNPIGICNSSKHSFSLAMLNLGCIRISFFRITTSGFRNLHPLKLQV